MNYLAHAYLSFEDPGILVGNMISDFVKGKKKFDYPSRILQGIDLHRAIDRFTDDHSATKRAKEIFRPAYRLYSSAFVDVVYDHFLASDKRIFPEQALAKFSQFVYSTLDDHYDLLPDQFQMMLPYMRTHDWLYNYRLKTGIGKSFGGLVRRSAYLDDSETAFVLLNENYTTLSECYESFIGDVREFARKGFDAVTPMQF